MLLSWFDIRKQLAAATKSFTQYPDGIINIQCFSDAIDVDYSNAESARQWFKQHFKQQWNEQENEISFNIASTNLPVIFTQTQDSPHKHHIRPLWQDVGYIKQGDTFNIEFKDANKDDPELIAFYSFKGGVGRTTSLLTYMAALIESHRKSAKSGEKIKLLLVDADLEAPGITYLLPSTGRADVSWIQFMESMQYPVSSPDEVTDFYATELRKVSIEKPGVELFVLPAFSGSSEQGMSQIADVQVKPEHLTRSTDLPWNCTDIILNLAQKLGATHTFIDLRAGLSELSSPVLFDPRVERFVVTTMSEQAICGTEYVLAKMSAMNSNEAIKSTDFDETKQPRVITTFLTKEFKDSPAHKDNISRLICAYSGIIDDETNLMDIIEGEFSTQLLHINTLDDYLTIIERHSPLYNSALSWAENKDDIKTSDTVIDTKHEITQLKELVGNQIYAEKAQSEALLVTEPLRNLAKRHVNTLPKITSIGSKGAGKTFNYLQICRKVTWYKFIDAIAPDSIESKDKKQLENTFIFPLIHSLNLYDTAREIIQATREALFQRTGIQNHYPQSKFQQALSLEKLKETPDWNDFWQQQIWNNFYQQEDFVSLMELNYRFKQKDIRVVFILDGLEDLFPDLADNSIERDALHALAYLPNTLNELPDNHIGLVSFFREDYIEHVVTQNLGQYRDRYHPFQLTWDAESFLKLVYWTCQQANLSFANADVQTLLPSEISQKLKQLWGLKLGKPNSREANTIRWVYAALSDLRGRLQARDIVRFLYYACDHGLTTPTSPEDRLLSPPSLRKGIKASSAEKVGEAKSEFPVLAKWIEKLDNVPDAVKSVPFASDEAQLNPEELRTLIDLGIVYEEKGSSVKKRYYLPELYREGLGFNIAAGARPKVLLMLKESLGKLPADI